MYVRVAVEPRFTRGGFATRGEDPTRGRSEKRTRYTALTTTTVKSSCSATLPVNSRTAS